MSRSFPADNLRAWKQPGSTTPYLPDDGVRPVVGLSASGVQSAVSSFGATGLLARHSDSAGNF